MKHKKVIMSLGAAVAITAPLVSVISCGNDFGPNYRYYGDIQVITDAGSVQDKSFNESAFLAAEDFADLKSSEKIPTTFGFSQPSATTTVLMQKAYLSALKENSKYLLLPGFTHSNGTAGDAINFAIKNHESYKDVRYINPDGLVGGIAHLLWDHYVNDELNASVVASYTEKDATGKFKDDKGNLYASIEDMKKAWETNKTIQPKWTFGADEASANRFGGYYNLGYNSYESGYLAAIYGGAYFNEVKKTNSDIKMSTFGGTPIPFGVTSFMDGYLQGIVRFNELVGYKWENNSWQADTIKTRGSDGKNYQPINAIFLGGNKASKADFTGSFDAGAATSKVLDLVNKGVQMILPVAGPQTGDVVGVIKSKALQRKVFAFGVDTDQSLVYDSSIILGSAVKGVYSSSSFALNVLTKNAEAPSFPSFGLKLKSDNTSEFYKYIYGNGTEEKPGDGSLLAKLIENAKGNEEKIRDAKMKVLPTGFVPSYGVMKKPEDLYGEFAKGTGMSWSALEAEAGTKPAAGPSNDFAKHTRDIYGSFLEVAQGGGE